MVEGPDGWREVLARIERVGARVGAGLAEGEGLLSRGMERRMHSRGAGDGLVRLKDSIQPTVSSQAL